MYYSSSVARSNGYYKIAYFLNAECELLNLDTTRKKWSIIEYSNLGEGFIGKVDDISLNPGDTVKEKSLRFVCVLDYRYRPMVGKFEAMYPTHHRKMSTNDCQSIAPSITNPVL